MLGLGFMLMGENGHNVTWALKNKLEEIRARCRPVFQSKASTIARSWWTT